MPKPALPAHDLSHARKLELIQLLFAGQPLPERYRPDRFGALVTAFQDSQA